MFWIIGAVILFVIIIFPSFIAAGRADRQSEQYYNNHYKNKK